MPGNEVSMCCVVCVFVCVCVCVCCVYKGAWFLQQWKVLWTRKTRTNRAGEEAPGQYDVQQALLSLSFLRLAPLVLLSCFSAT